MPGGSRPGLVQSQVAKKIWTWPESRDPLCAKQVANYTGRPTLHASRHHEALARLYLRGPNPKFQNSCDPLCAKQVADFSEALNFPRDPLCSACLPPKLKICNKSLSAKQVAGFLEAMDCGRDPLCKDHFLYKLQIGSNPFTAKQVAEYLRSWFPQPRATTSPA